jgi:hypothetical protein
MWYSEVLFLPDWNFDGFNDICYFLTQGRRRDFFKARRPLGLHISITLETLVHLQKDHSKI